MVITSNCFLTVWYTVIRKVTVGTFQGLFVSQGMCKMRKPTGNKQQRAATQAEWKQEARFSLSGTS